VPGNERATAQWRGRKGKLPLGGAESLASYPSNGTNDCLEGAKCGVVCSVAEGGKKRMSKREEKGDVQ